MKNINIDDVVVLHTLNQRYGVNFFMGLVDVPKFTELFKIDQRRYKLVDNYKIELHPITEVSSPQRTHYISDLNQLMRANEDNHTGFFIKGNADENLNGFFTKELIDEKDVQIGDILLKLDVGSGFQSVFTNRSKVSNYSIRRIFGKFKCTEFYPKFKNYMAHSIVGTRTHEFVIYRLTKVSLDLIIESERKNNVKNLQKKKH